MFPWFRALAVAAAALAITPPSTAGDGGPGNPYPPDVVGQIRSLADRADALGFHLNGAPEPTHCYHIQGVARSSGPGTPYMFLSQSGNNPGAFATLACTQWCEETNTPCTVVGDGPGYIHIVRMGSRDADGERLRSNRIVRWIAETADSPPDPADGIVKTIAFDGTGGWPAFGHPGGMQVVGDVLAVALEHPYGAEDIADDVNRVLFIDIRDPENPLPLTSHPIRTATDFTVGAVAVAAMPDGRYLMIATGKDGHLVRVFESDQTDLLDCGLTWQEKASWQPGLEPVDPPCWEIPPIAGYPGVSWGWPGGGWDDYAHQSLTFVREGGPSGQLYLVGARNSNAAPLLGDDMLDIYTVHWDGSSFGLGCAGQKHLYAHPSADGALFFHDKIADFAAGSGLHVSPTGEIVFYATEHDNDGPAGSIKAGEWRTRDMVLPGSPTLDPSIKSGGPYVVAEGSAQALAAEAALPATKAWVELWTDPDWSDDRYLVIDYLDRWKDNFDDFEELDDAAFNPFADGFGDQASSARWFSPAGCSIHLNRHDVEPSDPPLPPDDRATVGEEGEPDGKSHLGNLDDDAGLGGMDDSISSVIFQPDCDAYYDPAVLDVAWDLDGDLAFETPGTAVPFSAALLDGPASVPLAVSVVHRMDGRSASAVTSIEVYNLSPLVPPFGLRDGANRDVHGSAAATLAGLPVKLTGTFTDPGVPDTHRASVDWHDGTVSGPPDLDAFTGATGGFTGSVVETHAYSLAGEFTVAFEVVDDDGGIGGAATTVRIIDARDAILDVTARIDALIAGSSGAARRAWEDARDLLIGNNLGKPANGALDKLDAGDREAAVLRLEQTIERLQVASALTGVDTADMQAMLALAAWSIATEARRSR